MRLDQAEFHRRYEATPPDVRAELIDGVVFMHGPVGPDHGRAQLPVVVWLSFYAEDTPGVEVLIHTSTALGPKSELQPAASLRILAECGGRTHAERRFVRGAPELIVEVSHTTRYTDLGPKLDDYEAAGVSEYVVRAQEPDELLWHVLAEGRLVAVPPDQDGIYRSRAFPGLWLDPSALLAGDTRRLRAILDQGFATNEHGAFVRQLAAKRSSS
jgi:Uma2 family endonuclease